MQEELQDYGAIVGQHALEFDDVAKGLLPVFLRSGSLDPLFQHAAVPAVIEDDHLAAVGHFQPEAPQPRTLLLISSRRGDGVQLEAARIESLGERRDGRSLARSVPAFENDDGGYAVVPAGLLQVVQTQLQSRDAALVFFAGELLLQIDVFEHGSSSH